MRRPVWLDGSLVPASEATIPVLAHAAHRGSLAFDFGVFRATPERVAVFRARDHVRRLRRSASFLGLEIAYDDDALVAATRQTVDASELREGYVRWSAFVPTPEPDLLPRSRVLHVAIAAYEPRDLFAPGDEPPPRRPALRVAWFEDARKAPPEAFPPLAKIAAAYAGPMMAKRRAVAAGADEVLLLDSDGHVAEAPTANVFAVIAGALVTPPLGRILDGITRDSVLAIARAEGVPIREALLTTDALAGADEAFLTASSFPIAPIESVFGAPLGQPAPGPVTQRLRAVLEAAERGAEPRFQEWTRD